MPPPAAKQAAARLWTARPELHTDPLATKLAECMTPPAGFVRRFTRGRVRELKKGHNSVTAQNRTHVYMKFFHHKDLGNHLLQLCPKVVKHPVQVTNYFVHGRRYSDCGGIKYRMAHEKPARRLVDQRGRRSRTLYRKLNKCKCKVLTG